MKYLILTPHPPKHTIIFLHACLSPLSRDNPLFPWDKYPLPSPLSLPLLPHPLSCLSPILCPLSFWSQWIFVQRTWSWGSLQFLTWKADREQRPLVWIAVSSYLVNTSLSYISQVNMGEDSWMLTSAQTWRTFFSKAGGQGIQANLCLLCHVSKAQWTERKENMGLPYFFRKSFSD